MGNSQELNERYGTWLSIGPAPRPFTTGRRARSCRNIPINPKSPLLRRPRAGGVQGVEASSLWKSLT
jgi:hypothetical protein